MGITCRTQLHLKGQWINAKKQEIKIYQKQVTLYARGKGYALNVTRAMIRKLLEMGKVPFVHIEETNTASMNLALKAGFRKYGRVHWVYLSAAHLS